MDTLWQNGTFTHPDRIRQNEKKLWTTGTDAEKKLITDKIQTALAWQQQAGIPTWVGAWMPGNYNKGNTYSVEEQTVFAGFMTKALSDAGIPFAVNADTKYYNAEENTWISSMQPVLKQYSNKGRRSCYEQRNAIRCS